jgi:hypothetical protein
MKKGSLVVLKDTPFVLYKATIYVMDGDPFPSKGGVYTLASDIEEVFCESCNKPHKIVFLEEIPNISYPYDIFREVQGAAEVNVTELFEKV